MISFVCCGCNAQLRIGDKESGKLSRCPYCGANSRVPGYPRRTPKWKIALRIAIIPFLVVCFWAALFSLVGLGTTIMVSGVGAIAVLMLFLWGFVNLMTLITMPRTWWLIKRGGGDPFFDSLPSPLNYDPPEVRHQELFREKLRQENEQLLQPLVPPRS